jgi:electron transport complex protein RnfE
MDKLSVLKNGIIKENPVFVLLLGTCPSLAVTTMAVNGLGMGISTMLVLLCSNIAISALKDFIPDKVRIPAFVVLIAGFVTIVGFLVKAYTPELDQALGIFLPLIVVNCIILGRAEMFASKNSVVASALDAIGMGIGFTLALFIIGSIREFIGSGTWMGIIITADIITPMTIFMLAPGGFFVYGVLIALINYLSKGQAIKKTEMGCENCPSNNICHNNQKEGA